MCCLVCHRWAEAADSSRRNGRPRGVADAWIAASALEHDIPLITNSAGHYASAYIHKALLGWGTSDARDLAGT
jgi:predicted nucleic acid-binding protein